MSIVDSTIVPSILSTHILIPTESTHILICELQLPEFTSTVATVSRPACLANFTKTLGFISKKGFVVL